MQQLRERQKIKKKLYSRTVRIVLLIILIFLIRPTWNIYQKHVESKENLRRAEEELSLLQAKESALNQKIKELESDRGRDKEIREKFSVVKGGESVVVFTRNNDSGSEKTDDQSKGSFWTTFFSGIKGFLDF